MAPEHEELTANEEALAFYYQMGLATTAWAHVEFALAELIMFQFERADAQRAVDGFLSIENVRAKLQYADTIMATANLSDTDQADWTTLRQRIETWSKKRNALAHGWTLTDTEAKPGRRKMLLSTKPSVAGGRQDRSGGICIRDIVSYRLEFVALWKALTNFADNLLGQEATFPESQEQPRRPPTIAQIRKDLHAYFPRPPQPSGA